MSAVSLYSNPMFPPIISNNSSQIMLYGGALDDQKSSMDSTSTAGTDSYFDQSDSTPSSAFTTPSSSPKLLPQLLSEELITPFSLTPPLIQYQYPATEEIYLHLRTNSISLPKPPISYLQRPLTRAQAKQELAWHRHIEYLYNEALTYDTVHEMLVAEHRPLVPEMETNYFYTKSLLWEYHTLELNPHKPLPIPIDEDTLHPDYPSTAYLVSVVLLLVSGGGVALGSFLRKYVSSPS